MINFNNDWDAILKEEFQKEYYLKLREVLKNEYNTQVIYPNAYDIFNALRYTSYDNAKVVILGQDPYHEPGQAHGLAFSVQEGVNIPPSLINIYKEIKSDTGLDMPKTGSLTGWALQGVVLLNASLTVRAHKANSHKDIGWQIFTDNIIRILNDREKPLVFMLWGANARKKAELITNKSHLVLQAAHPSPLSAFDGFFGCKHFSKANEFLTANGIDAIDWSKNGAHGNIK